jgi:hypothetical protein
VFPLKRRVSPCRGSDLDHRLCIIGFETCGGTIDEIDSALRGR